MILKEFRKYKIEKFIGDLLYAKVGFFINTKNLYFIPFSTKIYKKMIYNINGLYSSYTKLLLLWKWDTAFIVVIVFIKSFHKV